MPAAAPIRRWAFIQFGDRTAPLSECRSAALPTPKLASSSRPARYRGSGGSSKLGGAEAHPGHWLRHVVEVTEDNLLEPLLALGNPRWKPKHLRIVVSRSRP